MLALAGIAEAQYTSTAFTYRGQLRKTGVSFNGNSDLAFRLYDAPSGGNQVGPTLVVNQYQIVDGLVMIDLDFGNNIFDGRSRWLEIDVGPSTLEPRQPIMAVPAFLFVEAFRPALPYGIGFAAGAMVLMVLVELLPEALESAPRPLVALLVSLTLVGMVAFQQLLG